ncbi:MAG: acyltransferase [Neptunomonas phycophila]
MGSKARIAYWDNWKGFAIIAVVAIHATNNTIFFPVGSFNWLFGIGFRQVVDFAVPIFLGMAGYFSAGSLNEKPLAFVKKRLVYIIFPYILFTSIYLLLKSRYQVPSWEWFAEGFYLGKGIGIGYFVIVLIQFIFLTLIYNKIENKKTHIYVMVFGTLLGAAFTYFFYANNSILTFSKFPYNAIFFFVWYPFYHLGYFFARYDVRLRIEKIKLEVLLFLLFVSVFVAFIEGLYWSYIKDNYSFGMSQVKISSFFVSLILFLMIINLNKSKGFLADNNVLTWLGRRSYAIYLIHLLFLYRLQSVLKGVNWLYEMQPFFILMSIVLAIGASMVSIFIVEKIFPNKIHRYALG